MKSKDSSKLIIFSWFDLQQHCPIDLRTVRRYYEDFNSKNSAMFRHHKYIDLVKEQLISARGDLDLLIASIMQVIYDRNLLTKPQDLYLYEMLKKNMSLLLFYVNQQEWKLITVHDDPMYMKSLIGSARLSAYSKIMQNIAEAIYNSLMKATEEYYNFKETDKLKREPRTFLYILYQILQVTFATLGGYSEENAKANKQPIPFGYSMPYSYAASDNAKENIKEAFEDNMGKSSFNPADFFSDTTPNIQIEGDDDSNV